MGKTGRQFVEQQGSIKAVGYSLKAIFQNLLD